MKTLARLGLVAALAVPASNAAAQDYPDLNAWASPDILTAGQTSIFVHFLWSVAEADNQLWLFSDYGNPVQKIFDVPGNYPDPSNSIPPGPVEITVNIGDKLLFGLCTSLGGGFADVCTDPASYTVFYMGPGATNNDGMIHAAIVPWNIWNAFATPGSPNAVEGAMVVGFEDNTAEGGADWDYNDVVFSFEGVSVVPEPATMVLLATGLIGLSGAGFIRRRRANRN